MAQKKQSAKGSVRLTKGDVTPPNPIRREEIVEEIVLLLRPWKDRMGEATVTAEVNRALDAHLKFANQQARVSNRKQIRDHAKRLDRALLAVESLLGAAPSSLVWFLYYPLTLVKTKPPRAEDIERAIRERTNSFPAELKRMRQACARAINPGFGPHPNYDNAKHISALGAYGLIEGLSNKKISGTKDGALRAIASLLYEAVSGKNADLKRACDSLLSDLRGAK